MHHYLTFKGEHNGQHQWLTYQKATLAAPFFPGLFFCDYIESPNQKNQEHPIPQAPIPIN